MRKKLNAIKAKRNATANSRRAVKRALGRARSIAASGSSGS